MKIDTDSKYVLKCFLVWRVLLFLPLFLAPHLISLRTGYLYEHIDNILFFPWANFDGVRYLSIAGRGYITEAAFFPLYPLLIRIVSLGGELFSLRQFLAGLAISNIAFLIALTMLYKIVKSDFSKATARWVVVFTLVFPTSFFFVSIYSESIFILLLVSSFWFARKKKWLLSALAGAILSATRLVGVLILPAIWLRFRRAIYFIIPVGIVWYAIFNYLKWGNPLYFIKVHGQLANGRSVTSIVLFPQTIYRYIKILLELPMSLFEWWVALLEVSSFFVAAYLLYLAYKKGVEKSYLLFCLLAFLVPASSGTFSALPRYIIVLFPIYIALALIKNNFLKKGLVLVFSCLLFILLMFFARGYYIS